MTKEKRAEKFIIKSTKVHRGKYKYFLDEYIDSQTKIPIECPIHGVFYQTPATHAYGCGCPV